jgi:hypothetical protein
MPQHSPALPDDPAAHIALARAQRAAGDELAALAHQVAAEALSAYARSGAAGELDPLCLVATGYFMKGEHGPAERWYRLLLRLNPQVAAAHQNLAAIHDARGEPALADARRQLAYSLQRVFVEPVEQATRRLLILGAGRAAGNVPMDTLLSGGRSLRIKYIIDHADPIEDAALPPFDLVFNAIGDADIAGPLMPRLQGFAQACRQPLLNAPAAVMQTRRDRLGDLLAGLDDVVVAPCHRYEGLPAEAAERDRRVAALGGAGQAWPLLLRPAASHGGQGLVRCDEPAALQAALQRSADAAHYLSRYIDYRSADGHWRKARVVFVDREPLPYHLAISPHWMVHYQSADMPGQPWKLAEEARFLQDPRAALGDRAMDAITAIGRRLDLDYAGVDFSLLPDGRVLVFEANATMLVHRERPGGPLAHKNPFVDRIAVAFERLLARAGAA